MKVFKLDENVLKNLKSYLITQPLEEVHEFLVNLKQDVSEFFISDLNKYLLTKPAKSVWDLFYALKKNISDAINAISDCSSEEGEPVKTIEVDEVNPTEIKSDK